MLDRARILELIPHQGTMCLLDEVIDWSEHDITCRTRSHLALDNPLRLNGRLSTLCGIEYGLQAAALHGALADGAPQSAGYLAALRSVDIVGTRLDDACVGALDVTAQLELRNADALIYAFQLRSSGGVALLSGRATIALSAPVR